MSSNLRVGMQTQMPGGRSTARDAAVKWAITYISRHLIIVCMANGFGVCP